MPRFFIDNIAGDELAIFGEDARHIAKSLRMRVGERLTVCDGQGHDCDCEILSLGDAVTLRAVDRQDNADEPETRVTLYQGYPKGDKLEFIVEKAVELGAARIVPVVTARSVARPDAASAARKTERLRRHALEAAKQCGRGIIPEVADTVDFAGMLAWLSRHDLAIFCYEDGGRPIREIIAERRGSDIAVIIGPEGGFEPEEAAEAVAHGAVAATLGRLILRTETAALAALAAVLIN